MNHKDYLIGLLKKFQRKEDIEIDPHAMLRAGLRNIDLEEVKNNLLHPSKRLSFANRLEPETDGLEKFKCYFGYSKTQCHIYIIKTNNKITVKTLIKLNKRWQKKAEKHGKI
jgi:hypothetical protein